MRLKKQSNLFSIKLMHWYLGNNNKLNDRFLKRYAEIIPVKCPVKFASGIASYIIAIIMNGV